MTYDVVIRNGTVVDGTGMAPYRADVGIAGRHIATIGRIREHGAVDIDAEGHVVTPGFIDGHTHLDAQVFWDELGANSCWHGITTAVMGHCGFTLAPAAARRAANWSCGTWNGPRTFQGWRWRRGSTGPGRRSPGTSTRSSDSPRASTTPPTSGTLRCARSSWASAPSTRRPVRTISKP